MDDEPNLDVTPPTKRMKISPPIYLLPNELLVKIIEKLPRTQWPALELVDPKFQDAVLLAWGSVREVDIDRDFIYSDAITDENDDDSEMVRGRLRREIAQRTEAILKELYERSPGITSLSGVSLIRDDPTLNTTAGQCLAKFEHFKTIKFDGKIYFSSQFVNSRNVHSFCDIPLINFVEFIESTRSRATLKEIHMERCDIPNDPVLVANFDQRLRAAFANDSNDPLLQLESFSMGKVDRCLHRVPLSFLDTIDSSRLTKLSLGSSHVEPAVLTHLVNGAPQLQHIDFAFLHACMFYVSTPVCQSRRRQPNKDLLAALAARLQLTSLGFNATWSGGCACNRLTAEFKHMLRTIGPRLLTFVFKPGSQPPDISMGEMRDIIQSDMPCLKSITLDKCCAVNPEELRGIADGKELEEIEIAPRANGTYDVSYMSILNEVMSTILNKSPRLQKFIGVNYIPDHRVLVELCKLRDLSDLRIRADRLTEENFIAFAQVFAEKLEVLHLGRIGEGVEPGLIEFITKAPQLRELMVNRNVTDRLLECLADSCPNLEKFSASYTYGNTFDAIQMVVDRCPKLRWLGVENTPRILASSLENLKVDQYRKLELEF